MTDVIDQPVSADKPKSKGKAPKRPSKVPSPVPVKRSGKPKQKPAVSVARFRKPANLLKKAADPTRLGVLVTLSRFPGTTVMGLCEALGGMSQPAMSHHLAMMRDSNLVDFERQGKSSLYSLTDEGRRLVGAVGRLLE